MQIVNVDIALYKSTSPNWLHIAKLQVATQKKITYRITYFEEKKRTYKIMCAPLVPLYMGSKNIG
jgi:hypothetical protein